MKISCLVIDDEPLAGSLFADYISRIPYLSLKGKCITALEALDFLQNHQVDLIFLDINMPTLSGMEFAKILPSEQKVIFTTAYTDYAVESYTVNAVDYLLKPVTFDRFMGAVEKASQLIRNHTSFQSDKSNFFIKSGKAMVKLGFEEIYFIEGLKDYVIFQLHHEKHIVYKKMKELEEILPSNFARVQHSFIVNTDHILKIEDNHVHVLNKRIPIGARYREEFISNVKKRLL
jgi:DNA-binding LytR/AlgR family response regulator